MAFREFVNSQAYHNALVRTTGIEPANLVWKTSMLPLHHVHITERSWSRYRRLFSVIVKDNRCLPARSVFNCTGLQRPCQVLSDTRIARYLNLSFQDICRSNQRIPDTLHAVPTMRTVLHGVGIPIININVANLIVFPREMQNVHALGLGFEPRPNGSKDRRATVTLSENTRLRSRWQARLQRNALPIHSAAKPVRLVLP